MGLKIMYMKVFVQCSIAFFLCAMSSAQFDINYEETKVPEFKVPEPLTTFSGERISTLQEWDTKRRPEVYEFFERKVYGKVPGPLDKVTFKTLEEGNNALGGKALRKQVEITLRKNGKSIRFTLLIYLPKGASKIPVFLGYNFHGNHTVTAEDEVLISNAWSMNNASLNIDNHKLTAASRGGRAHRWAVDNIIEKGFGLATIYYGEIDPDKSDMNDGIHALFYEKGQERPKRDEWGSLSAWAFGYSKALDYLLTDDAIDPTKVIVFGHSRLGKAALWAAASDQRFAGAISNNSGCGGAALSKRRFGETINVINTQFPHWFCHNFKGYNNNEEALPVDQHLLLALVAPRPLYVASAKEDQWADPQGEFLSAYHTSKVYELFHKKGISEAQLPEIQQPIQNTVAYHLRAGKHDVTEYDWEQYLIWAHKMFNINP